MCMYHISIILSLVEKCLVCFYFLATVNRAATNLANKFMWSTMSNLWGVYANESTAGSQCRTFCFLELSTLISIEATATQFLHSKYNYHLSKRKPTERKRIFASYIYIRLIFMIYKELDKQEVKNKTNNLALKMDHRYKQRVLE